MRLCGADHSHYFNNNAANVTAFVNVAVR